MPQTTSKLSKYFSLLTPSAESLVISSFLSVFVIVIDQSEDIKKVLGLPHNIQVTRAIFDFADKVLTKVIGTDHTDTLVVGLFWAIVGLVVYTFLHGLATFIANLDDDLDVRHFVWPKGANRYRPLENLAEQIVFRVAALIALIAVLLGPISVIIRGPVFTDTIGPNKPLQFLVWFVVSVLAWHLVVILLRLMALRPRLFG